MQLLLRDHTQESRSDELYAPDVKARLATTNSVVINIPQRLYSLQIELLHVNLFDISV